MSDSNIDVRAIISAEDHASAVLRRMKRQAEALQKAFAKPVVDSPILKQLQGMAEAQNRFAASMQRQASAMREAATGINRYAAGLRQAGRAEAALGRAAATRVRTANTELRQRLTFMGRMQTQRAREERDEERAHRNRLGRLEREHRASRRNAGRYAGRSYDAMRGMDFHRPAMLAAAGVGGAALAARRVLISEADTDAAEKNTIAYGGLSQGAARALREQWAGPLSIQLGATTAQMLAGYTEALKVGIPEAGAKEFSALAIKTSEAWSIPVEAVTDTLGIINQTLTAAGEAFDYKRLHSVANGIQHLAAKMATTPEKMISFLQRGAGAAALLGMSQEAGLAFGAASTSLGNQAAESGRMFDFVAGRLIKLPQLTKQNGLEGNQARAMVRALGYSSAADIDRQRRANPDEFLFDFVERFNRIRDPRKRDEAIRFFAGQEWLGEFGRMVTGSATLREAQKLAKESKGLDAIGQVWAVHQTKLLFVGKQIKAGFLNVLGEFGTVLSPIARQVGDFFLKWADSLKSGGIKQKFEAVLNGFITGLGFKSVTELLEGVFGTPGNDAQDSVERWRNIARAFGEGIRSAVEQILGVVRSLSSATGSGENLTKWAAYFGTWATAINMASPAFSILGTLASPFLAFGNALAAFLNIITAARLSAAVSALSAAGAGSAAGTAAGAAAAGGTAGTIARLFPWLAAGGALGWMIWDEAKRRDPNGQGFGLNDTARKLREEERRKAEERRKMFGPPSSETLSGGSGSNSLKGGIGKDLIYSVDDLTGSIDRLDQRLQLSSLTTPAAVSALTGANAVSGFVGSGGGGVGASGGAGSLYRAVPGERLPDTGLSRRGILDLIRKGETGTLGPQSWDAITGQWKGPKPSKAISQMTIAEVKAFQKHMLRNGVTDSAVGGFQINNVTLEDFQKRLGLSDSAVFDQTMQTRIAGAIAQSTGGNLNRLRGRWTALRKVPDSAIMEALRPSGPVAGGIHPLGGLGRLTSDFGMRKHPISGQYKMHKGIDLAAPAGTVVKAMKDGIVEQVNRWGDVTLKHLDGTSTTYRHINAAVAMGQKIGSGGIIGRLRANDPRSTGPHLHLEGTDAAGRLINPRSLISSVPPTPESLAKGVPLPPSRPSQGTAGQDVSARTPGPTISAPIHINGASQSPEEIATVVQRRLAEVYTWRTHDIESNMA